MKREHFLFFVKKDISFEEAYAELEEAGFEDLYGIEDFSSGEWQIGGWREEKIQKIWQFVEPVSEEALPDAINWEAEWAGFAPGFKEGRLEIDLSEYGMPGKSLVLTPGAGFGNLSHPTTRLMLNFMKGRVKGKTVLDIGCGSGILTLAAALLGAQRTFGIDIDDEALSHAHENLLLNRLEEKVIFAKEIEKKDLKPPLIVLMNMTLAEQKMAWQQFSFLNDFPKEIISSGILIEQKENYLKLVQSWGWKLIEEKEEEGWLAFFFTANS